MTGKLREAITFGLLVLAASSHAQWNEDFEGYVPGTILDNVNGWYGWDNMPAQAGEVSNAQARSGTNSIYIGPVGDAVHPLNGINSGRWVYSLWQYVPAGALGSGKLYFISQNLYNHGGPYGWWLQLYADGPGGVVNDDNRPAASPPQLIYDQWVNYRVLVDFGSLTIESFYNGEPLSSGAFDIGYGVPYEIASIDLWSDAGGTGYFDDIVLEQLGSGDLAVNSLTPSVLDPDPGATVDLTVEVQHGAASDLENVRVDIFVDPVTAPGATTLSPNTFLIMDVPAGAPAVATFPGYTSAGPALWRLYAVVNPDEAIASDPPANNVIGPELLGWVAGAGGGANPCGDCNRDNTVDILDALKAAQIAAIIVPVGPDDPMVCDVDSSPGITVIDALVMAQVSASLPAVMTCRDPRHLVQLQAPVTGTILNLGLGPVDVELDLWESGGLDIEEVRLEYSVDNGQNWANCTPHATSPPPLQANPSAAPIPTPAVGLQFVWDYDADLVSSGSFLLRATATLAGLPRTSEVQLTAN